MAEIMRISHIKLQNFRGVELLELNGLEDLPLVVISGRNGSGKSTLILAISLLWDTPGDLDSYSLVGPWGDHAEIEMSLHLTAGERAAMLKEAKEQGSDSRECPEFVKISMKLTEFNPPEYREWTEWVNTLRSRNFRRVNSFAHFTLIPAERAVSRAQIRSVSPDALSSQRADELRDEALKSTINNWSNFTLSDIPDYLATMDYTDLISAREGGGGDSTDYDEITGSFFEATGKGIERPTLSREGQVALFVDAQNGNRHSISSLSSGELEALGLMYMAKRLSSAGGVMLIDEPELHLHPALQTSILDMVRGAGESSQLWLSTHSPNLINSTPTDSIVSISPALGGRNQGSRIADQPSRLQLLEDLGVTPSSWLQHDRLIIVEGVTDKRYLELLFPIEASRSLIYVAGNRAGVDATVRTLEAGDQFLPWLAIRDRDIINGGEVDSEGSFTWSRRAFENIFLEGDLLSEVIAMAGGSMTASEIESELQRVALSEREEVESLLIEERLKQKVPATRPAARKDLKASLEHSIKIQASRLAEYDSVAGQVKVDLDAVWGDQWKVLVQGKRVLANFLRCTPFRSVADLSNAICKACRSSQSLLPADLDRLFGALSGESSLQKR
ncbi:ATP-dependent endonuclease [Streptomyces sp. NPDC056362]|uniref:ATP-dependent nuclease n=1 Tax=unclassified Streptomyces TaxID=2593676 RepID=UPI0035D822E8